MNIMNISVFRKKYILYCYVLTFSQVGIRDKPSIKPRQRDGTKVTKISIR